MKAVGAPVRLMEDEVEERTRTTTDAKEVHLVLCFEKRADQRSSLRLVAEQEFGPSKAISPALRR